VGLDPLGLIPAAMVSAGSAIASIWQVTERHAQEVCRKPHIARKLTDMNRGYYRNWGTRPFADSDRLAVAVRTAGSERLNAKGLRSAFVIAAAADQARNSRRWTGWSSIAEDGPGRLFVFTAWVGFGLAAAPGTWGTGTGSARPFIAKHRLSTVRARRQWRPRMRCGADPTGISPRTTGQRLGGYNADDFATLPYLGSAPAFRAGGTPIPDE